MSKTKKYTIFKTNNLDFNTVSFCMPICNLNKNTLCLGPVENKILFIMNDLVREKINNFVERCPNHIDGVTNVNDRHRLYDVIVAVHETNESVVDTKEELSNAIAASGKFMCADHVIADCMTALDTIPMFLDYYSN